MCTGHLSYLNSKSCSKAKPFNCNIKKHRYKKDVFFSTMKTATEKIIWYLKYSQFVHPPVWHHSTSLTRIKCLWLERSQDVKLVRWGFALPHRWGLRRLVDINISKFSSSEFRWQSLVANTALFSTGIQAEQMVIRRWWAGYGRVKAWWSFYSLIH